MLKSALTTQQDLNESLKLQRRRRYEEERMKRIFDAKQRLFGVDVPAIERQLADKKKQKQIEAECDRLWEKQNVSQQFIVNSKALEIEKRKKAMEADLHYYRCRYQKFEDRREFDINNPSIIKMSQPARAADDDVRLGVSSAQILGGEDINSNERKRQQREQTRSWLDQQKQEIQQAKESRLQDDKCFLDNIKSREKRLEEMVRDENAIKQELILNMRDYNLQMAKQKKIEREKSKLETAKDDLAEIYNMITQSREQAASKTDANEKIREDQALQRLNKIKEREQKLLMDQQWGQYVKNLNREQLLTAAEMEDKRAEHLKQYMNFNRELAAKQKQQRQELDELMKRNHLTTEYFDQFNKSSR